MSVFKKISSSRLEGGGLFLDRFFTRRSTFFFKPAHRKPRSHFSITYCTASMSGCGNSGCACGSDCKCGSNCSCGKRMMDIQDILNMQSFEHGNDGDSYDSRCAWPSCRG